MTQMDEISRINIVFKRIIGISSENDELRRQFIENINMVLDNMYEEGLFDPDGVNDPRGNQSIGIWSLSNVEGYDENENQ